MQYCNAIGPYKGGLRFAPNVCEDEFLFLALEQCLKNALTGLPLGGGKGGARFRTSDHSRHEVLRFCQAFMDEYVRHGGADVDVPAGDIGVGSREIGWLYGRWAKLTGRHVGMLTGKPEELGGIPGRVEATGYGTVRFAMRMLERLDRQIDGLRVTVSGAGNVALYAAERAILEGARVLSLSNSKGTARFGDGGLTREQLDEIKEATAEGTRLEAFAQDRSWLEFAEGTTPWSIECDVALPCATQNELDEPDARLLAAGGTVVVAEGANMPSTAAAVAAMKESGVVLGPGKAANAGGVAVSGFEMIQNATRDPWTRKEVLERLDEVMDEIHERCVQHSGNGKRPDYVRGANVASFYRLGRAIVATGPN